VCRQQFRQHQLAAASQHLLGPDHGLHRVVRALDQHVWFERRDQAERRVVLEDHHGVHRLQ
jgi:hypothetical protein